MMEDERNGGEGEMKSFGSDEEKKGRELCARLSERENEQKFLSNEGLCCGVERDEFLVVRWCYCSGGCCYCRDGYSGSCCVTVRVEVIVLVEMVVVGFGYCGYSVVLWECRTKKISMVRWGCVDVGGMSFDGEEVLLVVESGRE